MGVAGPNALALCIRIAGPGDAVRRGAWSHDAAGTVAGGAAAHTSRQVGERNEWVRHAYYVGGCISRRWVRTTWVNACDVGG